MNIPGELNPTPRLLLGPGPCDAHPRVLRAMATPLVSHLDPYFLVVMRETQEMLRQVYRTRNAVTFPVTAQSPNATRNRVDSRTRCSISRFSSFATAPSINATSTSAGYAFTSMIGL